MASRADVEAGKAHVLLYLKNLLSRQLKQVGTDLKKIGQDAMAVGRQIATAAAAAAVPLVLSAKTFADFDDQMRAVKGVTQASGEEFERLTAKAKQLGASTSFTAGQVAALMVELGRAGFKPDQIEEMTGAVLDLARATGTEAALSAGIMSASIRQFNLPASDAVRVADALTAAANKSFNTVEALGEAMSYAGPVAADFGMSIEETLSILGALGNVGIQGSNAGTAVRRLLTISGAEAEKLKGIFGVAFVDAAGNARPLVQVLDEVNQATASLGTAERAKKFNEAFGLLGITSASAISKNTVSVRELLAEIQKAGGVASATAKEMDSGLGGSLRIMYSALEGVAIALGSALAKPLQQIAAYVIQAADAIRDFVNQNQGLIVTIAGVIAAVGAVGAAIFAAGGVMFVAGSAITIVTGIVGALGTALAAILSPVGLAVAAVAGLVYAWARFTISGQAAVNWVSGALATMFSFVKEIVGGIGDALAGGDLKLAAQIGWAAILLVWEQAKLQALAVWLDLKNAALDSWDALVAGIQAGVAFVAGLLTGFLDQVFPAWRAIPGLLSAGWNTFKAAAQGAITLVTAGINALIDRVKALFQGIVAVAKAVLPVLKTEAAGATQATKAAIETVSGVDIDQVLATGTTAGTGAAAGGIGNLAGKRAHRHAERDKALADQQKRVADQRAELDRLLADARKSRTSSAAAAAPATAGGLAAASPKGIAAAGATSEVASTFSAAAFVALAQGAASSNPVVRELKESKQVQKQTLKSIDENVRATKTLERALTVA